MSSQPHQQHSMNVRPEQLLEFVRAMLGGDSGRPDDEHPLPPGPWDPVIRAALEQVEVFGPTPEPWRVLGQRQVPWEVILESIFRRHPEIFDVIGGGHNPLERVALNPQPLPPRYAFLVAASQAVIQRAELFQEFADVASHDGSERGIIVIGGYVSRFCDDWCGNGFKLRWPFPGPRPHWFTHELDGIDLVVMATQFEQAAKEAFSPDLRQHLATASARFAEAGMSRMQVVRERTG